MTSQTLTPHHSGFADRVRNVPHEYRRALAAVVALAIAIRLVTLALVGPRLGVDSQSYLLQGAEILRQGPRSFLGFAAEQPPPYSLLFSLCAAVPGRNPGWAMGAVPACLGGRSASL